MKRIGLEKIKRVFSVPRTLEQAALLLVVGTLSIVILVTELVNVGILLAIVVYDGIKRVIKYVLKGGKYE